jgi:hypothetical protein
VNSVAAEILADLVVPPLLLGDLVGRKWSFHGIGEKGRNQCLDRKSEGSAVKDVGKCGMDHLFLMEYGFKRDLIETGAGSEEDKTFIMAEVPNTEEAQVLGIAYSREENEADLVAAVDLVAKISAGGFDLLLPALDAVRLDDFFQERVDGKTPPVEVIFADEDRIFFGMVETKSFVEFS